MLRARTETFLAISPPGDDPAIGWARGSLDDEGCIPAHPTRAMALMAALKGNLYAQDPDEVQPLVDRLLGSTWRTAPQILPFDDHPAVIQGRRLDRALLIEIKLRADRYACGAVWPHAAARRLAAEASLHAAFTGSILCEQEPSRHDFTAAGKVVSLQAIRLRRTIHIMTDRCDAARENPDLGWLSLRLTRAIGGLRRELAQAEGIERAG